MASPDEVSLNEIILIGIHIKKASLMTMPLIEVSLDAKSLDETLLIGISLTKVSLIEASLN